MFRIAGFRCIRPFGLRGKERPIHAPVSPAPSKIPYGGFSPVRLQTSIRVPPSSAQRRLIDTFLPCRASTRFSCPVSWTCVPSERAERRLRITRPVALGSAAGSIVQPPQRLLWPHPRLWRSATAYEFVRSVTQASEVPQFTLPVLWHVPPSISRRFRRFHPTVHPSPVLFSSNAERFNNRSARPIRSSLIAHETAKFTLCYGPHHCSPHPVGTFTSELSLLDVAIQQRRISLRGQQSISHDWSFTSWTSSLMGCNRTPQSHPPSLLTGNTPGKKGVVPVCRDLAEIVEFYPILE